MIFDDEIEQMCCFGFDTRVGVFSVGRLEDITEDTLEITMIFFLSKEFTGLSSTHKFGLEGKDIGIELLWLDMDGLRSRLCRDETLFIKSVQTKPSLTEYLD